VRYRIYAVWVEASAFDQQWQLDIGCYLPPEDSQQHPGDYGRAEPIFNDPREYMKVPLMGLNLDPAFPFTVSFNDGRHRFALMRNAGMNPIPVSLMSRQCLENTLKLGLLSAESRKQSA
jgi:hypothetical protein